MEPTRTQTIAVTQWATLMALAQLWSSGVVGQVAFGFVVIAVGCLVLVPHCGLIGVAQVAVAAIIAQMLVKVWFLRQSLRRVVVAEWS